MRATLGGLRDPDTVVEDQIAGRIRDYPARERVPGFERGIVEPD